ncbi:IclR family transcriptional regulator [Arthrobacter ginkgonis]|uniref:IclR family transcriptional regulator n=1 Tax=Arthrobacter ginkgonis TaxID=1630594 RepID=A0ABP7D175_9MICC
MTVEPKASEARSASSMRSLSRAIEVFEQLQRYDHPQRLNQIAKDCGMSSPTTLRILRVLQEYGLVSQTDKSYRIGPAVLPAARVFLESDPLARAARPILQHLAEQTGLTASLYSKLGFERVLVERVVGAASLGYDLPQGRRLPLTVGAAGKILVAALDADQLEQVVTASVERKYEPAGFTVAELRRRLPPPGEDFAYSEDERATGVVSVAVAVPSRSGTITESISLTSPMESSSRDDLLAQVPELRHSARRLADLLASTMY